MPATPRYRAILFDFDYTLGDSSVGAVDCMRTALAGLGLPDVNPATCARTIGLSLPSTLVALAGPQHAHLAPQFQELFMARADEVMVAQALVYDFSGALLADLRAAGYRLAIVTNKRCDRITGILGRYGLGGAVETVVGAQDVENAKPAPDALLKALERLGLQPADALYVGDNVVDAQAAEAAGVTFVGVTTGHTAADALEPYPHLAILPDASALPALLGLPGR